jgi:hypothetical protein
MIEGKRCDAGNVNSQRFWNKGSVAMEFYSAIRKNGTV